MALPLTVGGRHPRPSPGHPRNHSHFLSPIPPTSHTLDGEGLCGGAVRGGGGGAVGRTTGRCRTRRTTQSRTTGRLEVRDGAGRRRAGRVRTGGRRGPARRGFSGLARPAPSGLGPGLWEAGRFGTVHGLMYRKRKSRNVHRTLDPGKDQPMELVISFTSSHSRTSEGPVIGFAHPAARELRLGGTQAPGRCCVGGGPAHPRVKCPPEPSGAT